jgi:hypothetical protein
MSPDEAVAGDTSGSNGSTRSIVDVAIVGAAGLALLIAHIARYPVDSLIPLRVDLLSLPDGGKLLEAGRALLTVAAINLAAWTLGGLVSRSVPLPRTIADLSALFRVGVGFGVLALAVLVLAALHLLVPVAFYGLVLIPSLLAAISGWKRSRERGAALGSRVEAWRARWLWAAYGALLVAPLLGALDHAVGWDAQTYHLAFPEQYLLHNGIVMTPFSHLSGYIMSTQLLYLLGLALGGQSAAVLLHFQFGLLCLIAVSILARRSSPRAGALAPLFLLACPLFQQELGWAYSDLPLAFYGLLAAAALIGWMSDEDDTGALLHAGIAIGLAASTRYLGLSFLAFFCLLVWLPPRHRHVAANLRACMWLVGIASAVLAPWLIRNLVLTGNPVTPLLQSVFHASGEEFISPVVMRQSTEFLQRVGMGRDLGALFSLPWNLVMRSQPGVYTNSFGFQITPLYVIALLAAGVVGRRLESPLLRPLLILIGLGTLFWFYSFQEARFLLPVFVLIALVGALALDALIERGPRWSIALLAIPIGAAVYTQAQQLAGLPLLYADALGRVDASTWAQREAPAAAAYLRGRLDEDDRLMLLFEERGYLFRGFDYLPYHIGVGGPTLQYIHRFESAQSLRCGLESLGVTHLLYHKSVAGGTRFVRGYGPADYAGDLARVSEMTSRYGTLLFEKDSVEVYRLKPAACPGG